jgi:dihydropteroate synthase
VGSRAFVDGLLPSSALSVESAKGARHRCAKRIEVTPLELPNGKSVNVGSPIPIMGIVNVTPDSFSDGGAYATSDAAIEHGVSLAAQGAAVLDIGGESTRPGAVAVAADEELSRVIPVIAGLHGRVAAPISIDTMKARVAAAAIEAGASIVNDVWGLQYDREMARVVADTGAAVVLMHNRTSIDPELDIVADVLGFLVRSIDVALAAGVERRRLLIDPGFGFGKTKAQNLELVRRLRELTVLGCPILLGVSRKSTLAAVTGKKIPAERMVASVAAGVVGVMNGAAVLRAHDVAAHVEAMQVLNAIAAHPPVSSGS